MSTEQNTALVKRFIDELCNGRKLNLAGELYSNDHAYHDPSVPQAGPGPEGVKDVIATYQQAFDGARWTIREVIATGDTVVLRWNGSGTHTGELKGISPTGKKVSVEGLWMFKISGGKIVESWNHWDTLGLMQQLGAVPAMSEAKK